MDGFSDRGSIPLISILDFHVMAILAGGREAEHMPRMDRYVLFSFNEQYWTGFLTEIWSFLFSERI